MDELPDPPPGEPDEEGVMPPEDDGPSPINWPPSANVEGEPGPPLDVVPQPASAMLTEAAAHGRDSLESMRWVVTSWILYETRALLDCLHLTADDVDLARGTVTIAKQADRASKGRSPTARPGRDRTQLSGIPGRTAW